MTSGAYAFIYDDFVSDRQHERLMAEIEARLATLNVSGRVSRLALFRSAKDLVESMVSQGVTTIVVFGNDRSLDKVMWFLPDLSVTLGYVPVTEPSRIASVFGIPTGAAACDVLAARLIETIDVGKINGRYFVSEISMPQTVAAVDIEGRYRLSPANGGSIAIRNLGNGGIKGEPHADARDGLLEVVITPHEETKRGWKRSRSQQQTRACMTHGEIISPEPVDVRVDGHVMNGMQFQISIVPKKLRVIMGRNRVMSGA